MTTHLYKILGRRNEPIYVGISDNLALRIRQHSSDAWWAEMRSVASVEYKTREEAIIARKKALREEHPKYNKFGVQEQRTDPFMEEAEKVGDSEWITMATAAEILGVSYKTIRRWIASGQIRAKRIGPRLIRVERSSLGLPAHAIGYQENH